MNVLFYCLLIKLCKGKCICLSKVKLAFLQGDSKIYMTCTTWEAVPLILSFILACFFCQSCLFNFHIINHIFSSAPEVTVVTTVVLSHQIKWGNVLGCLFIYSPKENNLLVSASTQNNYLEIPNRNLSHLIRKHPFTKLKFRCAFFFYFKFSSFILRPHQFPLSHHVSGDCSCHQGVCPTPVKFLLSRGASFLSQQSIQ